MELLMDNFQSMIVELRRTTIRTVLDGLNNDPTPGWAQVARGLLSDFADVLNTEDSAVDQSTLDALNEINSQLKLTGTD